MGYLCSERNSLHVGMDQEKVVLGREDYTSKYDDYLVDEGMDTSILTIVRWNLTASEKEKGVCFYISKSLVVEVKAKRLTIGMGIV